MRVLHTSDWHLGQTLHQFDRSYEHERFLAWLLDSLVAEDVDGLLIAGDVFDNANPSAAAQAQLYRFLTEARRRVPHLNIVMTAGNHDSPGRLEAPAPFLKLLCANVVGQVAQSEDGSHFNRLVVPLTNRHGQVSAWCIAMPFLRPSDVPRVDDAEDPYMAGVDAIYQGAFEIANKKREVGQAIIAIGHCHLAGGSVSEESERRIVIGGAEALSADIFNDAIAYVALGHLHRAQTIGGDPTRRYCGSPLPMSFSEIHYPHQVVVLDLDGEAVANIRELHVPRFVDLLRVPAKPASLEAAVAELAALELAERPEAEWPYLQVRIELTQPEPALRAQIETAVAGKPVRLARIETSYARHGAVEVAPTISVDELNSLAPIDFFQRLYTHRYGEAASAELVTAFSELINAPEASA
jgi:exonuclease SbcD